MELRNGEQFTLSTDPLTLLMQLEDETVEDEFETDSVIEQRETVLLAAQFKSKIFQE